jgi:hypothetical protein
MRPMLSPAVVPAKAGTHNHRRARMAPAVTMDFRLRGNDADRFRKARFVQD